ncbi:hypothetical protein L228DRAFT_271443 [Xylona heveae TC161]|uniref:FUN14-domain-containing protein n=1 Tax=Xylona heveae (strain CBS 132557 / TC161) TaxID=1328760 RepID=A0A164ZJZ9_XYLHT|nr:hypothetical protein L228DRAFT_271443 [Xylona heveae TC161]KZF19190.1 hypothetical protein L228DRAFT_271443 [Xylona heveae TC161]
MSSTASKLCSFSTSSTSSIISTPARIASRASISRASFSKPSLSSFSTARLTPRNSRTIRRAGLGLCVGATLGLGAGSPVIQSLRPQIMYCDNGFEAFETKVGLKTTKELDREIESGREKYTYEKDAKAPVVGSETNKGVLIRQLSAGSVLGLLCGVAVSVFSKTLALVFGLAVVIVQAAASGGVHLIPYRRLQRYVQRVDIRSVLYDNIIFKLSFGTTFALAAFADFS